MNLEQLRDFLAWMTVLNVGILLLSAGLLILCRSFIHRIHGKWFGLPATTLDVITYCYLGIYKICILLFNVVPYLSLRWFF